MSREQKELLARAVVVAVSLVAIAVVASGCAGLLNPSANRHEQPGQTEALRLMMEYYGPTPRNTTPVKVYWVEPPHLTCNDGKGFLDGMNRCVAGTTADPYSFAAALLTRDTPISETSACHETYHIYLARWGAWDPNHERPEWPDKVGGCILTLRAGGF